MKANTAFAKSSGGCQVERSSSSVCKVAKKLSATELFRVVNYS
ncbi:MAG TPA: hypothetical protein VFF32_15775 [Dermatophilaceae bacterium]|nr:hypothetical protein [Dermatophilaceae bacterium]